MGVRHQPGTPGRLDGGDGEGQDHRGRIGRGRCIDGVFEWYEEEDPGATRSLLDLVGEVPDLIDCDFQSEYRIDLDDARAAGKPYLWFKTRLSGLLSADTRVARWLQAESDQSKPADGGAS